MLMMIGFYGIVFEVTHPGFGVPGIAGIICLITGLYGLSMLPLNYAALALIIAGIAFLVADVFVTSLGLLTIGGIATMVFGSLMLIDSSSELLRVSWSVIASCVLSGAAITIFLIGAIVKAHRRKPLTGQEHLIGQTAIADSDINPFGTVRVHGEIWQARSETPIQKGTRVTITSTNHLELTVKP
jgi:membrane-bound serine protease (ClpP class)